ncbi:TRAP transporter large permease [Sedimenticola thiotaurini]|uniref:TRAP transporter large permease protein n=1 Tax=Sedimenticola thiotaurini TaxID=1543721 RepID=A0A0F7JTR3_9GAMM|nr:TRAP transporter large permease subunit [Sedimenticola thiotaurini]AKH19027.1 C4-dicarboxylate ABC transporter permease [Sedimenticola thiotaurini]
MDPLLMTLILTLLLFGLLATGLWVAVTLFLIAFIGLLLNDTGSPGLIMATTTWGASSGWGLTALPLFIWMGEILFRTRLSEDLFSGLAPWLNHLPGRLLHVNILGCGIFAAVSGSSAATAATIGRMTAPELAKRGYDERMSLGTLAGSGTLGLLIPPSIILIVYGVSAEVSIARLFIAGALPGLMLILLFMGYTMFWATLNRKRMPPADPNLPLGRKLRASLHLFPVLGLILFVLGSIYGGLATATEAAVFGVFGALILSALTGTLSRENFVVSLMGATRTSCMIAFILAGAAFLTIAMGFTGIPRALAEYIATLGLDSLGLIVVLTLFFVLLGCFLDGISVVVLTTSVVLPMVEQAGIDLLWFGIYLVLVVEMSQITPPVGFNLFVLQGLTGKNILRIAVYALPFFLLLLVAVVLVTAFPQIATWLPSMMTRG